MEFSTFCIILFGRYQWSKPIPSMNQVTLRSIFRYLYKTKGITLIKIAGLAIAICMALVVFLTVSYEFSFDRHHPSGENVYRIVSHFGKGPDTRYLPGVPMPLPGVLKNEVAGIQQV